MWADVLAIWWSQCTRCDQILQAHLCATDRVQLLRSEQTGVAIDLQYVYISKTTHMIMSIHVFSLNTEENKPKLFVVKMNHLLESPLYLMLVLKSHTFAAYFPFPDNKFGKLSDWQVYNLTFSPVYSQHCKKIWTYQHQEITKYASFC